MLWATVHGKHKQRHMHLHAYACMRTYQVETGTSLKWSCRIGEGELTYRTRRNCLNGCDLDQPCIRLLVCMCATNWWVLLHADESLRTHTHTFICMHKWITYMHICMKESRNGANSDNLLESIALLLKIYSCMHLWMYVCMCMYSICMCRKNSYYVCLYLGARIKPLLRAPFF